MNPSKTPPASSYSSPTSVFLAFLFSLILLEQLIYLKKKGSLPGPFIIFPFLGNALYMVRNPTSFWQSQAIAARTSGKGLAANYIFGRFIVFIQDSDLSLKIFTNVRPDAFHLIGHPFGKKLFGEHNLIYMFDQQHKDLRGRLAPNFTLKALSTYLHLQQTVILQHLEKWKNLAEKAKNPIALRIHCRDLNLETSQTVFVGPYLNSREKEEFKKDYYLFNVGLMKLPIDIPGFSFRQAKLAVRRLIKTLSGCAAKSKENMRRGEEPGCLIDFWMTETVKEIDEASVSGKPRQPHSGDDEIGGHIFDFLFAAQDASTSSLLWAITLLDSHPDILAKIREEQDRIRQLGSDARAAFISPEQLREMKYTEMVAKEVVRFRPPATLVPHIAGEDFPIAENYTVPKGTIVFPSVYESSFQGFPEPDRFDPERFSESRQEDKVFRHNFLAFGAGPHHCIGQRYALNHLILFIALFTTELDFRRHMTPGCDDVSYVPTIAPRDDCLLYLSPRVKQ